MNRDDIKRIYLETTLNLPTFNTDDKYFEYFVYDILEGGKRWELVNEYFKNEKQNFIEERKALLGELIRDFYERKTYEIVARMNKTYPRFFNRKKYVRNQGKTILHVDISKACYQVAKYAGVYIEDTWTDYLKTKTQNSFILGFDQTLMRQVFNNGFYSNKRYDCPVFDSALPELLWVAYDNGLNDLLETNGFEKITLLKDSFNYISLDESKIQSFKSVWDENETKSFNNIIMHYDIYKEDYMRFYIPEIDNTLESRIKIRNNKIEIKDMLFDEHYPQFKKIANGEQIIEKDLLFSPYGKKTEKITLIK